MKGKSVREGEISPFVRLGLAGLLLVVLGGCASQRAFHSGEREMKRQDFDAAVIEYSKAVALDPGNARYEVALARAKIQASSVHFTRGTRFHEAGSLEKAIGEYQQTLLLNPDNQHAQVELQRALRELQRLNMGPSEIEKARAAARRRDLGPPRLNPGSNIPILLNFQDVELGKIFEALSKASGINFIYDDKVDLDKKRTIDIGNVTMEKALDILMLQTKNFYMVVDEYTILIAPDNRQSRQAYEDQVIRTFFLSNAETKTVVTLIRSLLQSRSLAENADLNSITIKDTPDKVAIAERIILANDKAKGEVLVDVELVEINRSRMRTIGIDIDTNALGISFRGGSQSLPLNGLDALSQQGNWTIGPIPNITLDFLKSDSDTRTIAQPQLRVSEGEQAEILIGDRVPIPTTSFNTSQTVGGNIVPITSFTYQNVGITVQVKPRVHHNKEVTLEVQVEVSQLSGSVVGAGGQEQPIIGTRQIQTVTRLRDGETNLLAGLINRSNQYSEGGVPGLSEIPGLSKLFARNSSDQTETDIVLTMTPRIIRIPDITEDDLTTLWVGTEDTVQLRGPSRNAFGVGPFSGEPMASLESEEANGRRAGDDIRPRPDGRQAGDDDRPRTPNRISRGESGGDSGRPAPPPARAGSTSRDDADSGANRRPGNNANPGTAGAVGSQQRDQPDPDPIDDPDRGFEEDEPEIEEIDAPEEEPRRSPFDDDDLDEDDPPLTPSLVNMVTAKNSYAVGEVVVVQTFLQNGQNVGSVPFHLRFNPQVLQFQQPAEEGGLLNSDGTNTVFLATPNATGAAVIVGHSRMGSGEGVTGSGLLGTFRFLAIGPGDAGLAFTSASVKDPQARNLPAAFNAAAVTVE